MNEVGRRFGRQDNIRPRGMIKFLVFHLYHGIYLSVRISDRDVQYWMKYVDNGRDLSLHVHAKEA